MPETIPEDDAADEIRVVTDETPPATAAVDSTAERSAQYFRKETPPQQQEVRQNSRDKSRAIPDDEDDLGPRVQKRLNQFRRRTGDAEARAQSLAEENRRLVAQLHDTNAAALTHYEGATQARLEAAKRDAQEAYESGDGQRVVEANRKLASAQVALDNVETTKRQRQQEETQRAAQPAAPARPQFSARTQAWVDDHPWFESDQEARRDALQVHERLVRSGFQPESEEYFAELDRRCKALFPEHFDDDEEADPPPRKAAVDTPAPRRPAAPPVAGVSRTAAPPQQQRTARQPVEIKLTKDQLEAAAISGVSPKAYAMSLHTSSKEGRR